MRRRVAAEAERFWYMPTDMPPPISVSPAIISSNRKYGTSNWNSTVVSSILTIRPGLPPGDMSAIAVGTISLLP